MSSVAVGTAWPSSWTATFTKPSNESAPGLNVIVWRLSIQAGLSQPLTTPSRPGGVIRSTYVHDVPPSTRDVHVPGSRPRECMNVNATLVPSGETRGRYGPAKPEPPLRPSHVSTGLPIGFPPCENREL